MLKPRAPRPSHEAPRNWMPVGRMLRRARLSGDVCTSGAITSTMRRKSSVRPGQLRRRGNLNNANSTSIAEVSSRVQERQRPATRASGGWPIVLTIDSHPSSSSGLAAGTCGALISLGPLPALRLLSGTSGNRSPLSARLMPAGLCCSTDEAGVLPRTSRPTRNDTNPKAAQQPTRYRE